MKPRKRNAHHDRVMEDYYAARDAWEADREAVAIGYVTEMREYAEANPHPKFKDFLILHSHKEY